MKPVSNKTKTYLIKVMKKLPPTTTTQELLDFVRRRKPTVYERMFESEIVKLGQEAGLGVK